MTERHKELATALPLLAPLPGPNRTLEGDWRIAAARPGQQADYAAPDFDDSAWERLARPTLRRATLDRDTVWYRHRFEAGPPPPGRRTLLRVGGAFYHTDAWLNGVPLGGHTGYFQPFGYDLTDHLRPGQNTFALRCRTPIEAQSFKRKTAVLGLFADWDCKPYPSLLYPNLPAPYEWSVPVGLWQPASLHEAGPVLAEALLILPEVAQPAWPTSPEAPGAESARLRVRLRLRNLTVAPQAAALRLEIAPHNFDSAPGASADLSLGLAAAESRQHEFDLTLPEPRLWFPWSHGRPCLYQARLTVEAGGQRQTLTQTFGVRDIRAVIGSDRWEWRLNGRRVFLRGSNYVSDFDLDQMTPEGIARDLDLARAANLDLLRVHAHLAPQPVYDLCDGRGLMVMCDFPLIWTYAHRLPPAEASIFEASVRQQAADMVWLFGSHPSICLWSMHNEPPWTPEGSFLGGELHAAQTNRALDEGSARQVRELDPTRPAIAASGEFDRHLYHGWYTSHWRDLQSLAPAFPTEFGVQALPNLESPFWATVNTDWPVEADDPTWAHAGYQSVFWASPGVGTPAQYESLADYVAESQAYQAFYIRYAIDQWRRQKFAPTGGYVHFAFTDGWPAITWSVLDYVRLPKAGYQALAEASRPVHVCLELEPGYEVEHGFHLVYAEDGRLRLKLYLVNDDYARGGTVRVEWWLERRDGWLRGLASFLRRRLGKKGVRVELPPADAGARLIAELAHPLRHPGNYTFHVRAAQGLQVLDESRLDFRVGEPRAHARAPRRVPGLLIHKVYQMGSLRHTGDGFTFSMRNPAMPAALQRLVEFRVDGQPINNAQIEFVSGGLSRRASTITPHAPLEIPSGERFAVVIGGQRLSPGRHELELTAQFLGLGEITARLHDRLV